MKISLPSILSTLFYIGIVWINIIVFEKFNSGTSVPTPVYLFILIFIVGFLFATYLIINKGKIIFIKDKSLTLIYPLKFKSSKILYEEIKSIKTYWTNVPRGPRFRIMNISSQNLDFSVSDLEVENIDQLFMELNQKYNNTHLQETINCQKYNLIYYFIFLGFGLCCTAILLSKLTGEVSFDFGYWFSLSYSTYAMIKSAALLTKYYKIKNKA